MRKIFITLVLGTIAYAFSMYSMAHEGDGNRLISKTAAKNATLSNCDKGYCSMSEEQDQRGARRE